MLRNVKPMPRIRWKTGHLAVPQGPARRNRCAGHMVGVPAIANCGLRAEALAVREERRADGPFRKVGSAFLVHKCAGIPPLTGVARAQAADGKASPSFHDRPSQTHDFSAYA